MQILLFVSLFIGAVSVKEMMTGKLRLLMLAVAAVILAVLCITGGMSFILLLPFLIYEVMSEFPAIPMPFYFVPLFLVFIQNPVGVIPRILMISLLSMIYIQHDLIIREYRKRMMDDMVQEQSLKRDMRETEYAVKAQLRRNMLKTENQILEERAKLSQTLHDKLGHSINGSIYQLEGAKVLMEKDRERAGKMIQAVIDQLRSGMDEIRGILRKERPEKKELAMLELYKLCEDCEDKGVEAEVSVEGDAAQISDAVWEVILDNTFEAVTNSMKYSECRHIDIQIVVMNRMVRCTVRDNGKGCHHFEDGMGISGMRQRVRAVNGTIDFETEIGFTVKMLLPLE